MVENNFSAVQTLIDKGVGKRKSSLHPDQDVPDINQAGKANFIDADTFIDDSGNNIRLANVDADETSKIFGSTEDKYGREELGESISEYQTNLIQELAVEHGFTNSIKTQGKSKTYNRSVGDLTNKYGELFSDFLISRGVLDPQQAKTLDKIDQFADPYQAQASTVGRLDRYERDTAGQKDDLDRVVEAIPRISQSIREDYNLPRLATLAYDTEEYRSGLTSEGQQLIYKEGVVENRIDGADAAGYSTKGRLGKLGDELSKGWYGGVEGIYGAISLFGDLLDAKGLSAYGDEHKARIAGEVKKIPQLKDVQLYNEKGNWDVDGVGDFVSKISYLGAGSIPYFGLTLGAAAVGTVAAPVIGTTAALGVSVAIPSLVYAGQAWNGQPDEKKDAGKALLSGIGQGVVDRLAIPAKILPKGANIFSVVGQSAAVKYLAKANNYTSAQARKLLDKVVAETASDTLRGVATNFARVAAIGTTEFIKGGAREGSTEYIQEQLGIWGENQEIEDEARRVRLGTAAAAGFGIGGVIDVAGPLIGLGRDKLRDFDKEKIDSNWVSSEITENEARDTVRIDEMSKYGYVRPPIAIANEAKAAELNETPASLDEVVGNYKPDAATRAKRGFSGAFAGSFEHVLNRYLQYPQVRNIASIFGIGDMRPGQNYQNITDDLYASWIGENLIDSRAFRGEGFNPDATNEIYSTYSSLKQAREDVRSIIKGKGFKGNWSEDTRHLLKKIADATSKAEQDSAYGMTNALTVDLLTPTVDRVKLAKNRAEVSRELKTSTNLSQKEISDGIDRILSSQRNTSTGTGSSIDKASKAIESASSTIVKAISDLDKFKTVRNENAFENAQGNASKTATVIRTNRFLGNDGQVIAKMLSGLPAEVQQDIGYGLREIFQGYDGTKQLSSPTMKYLLNTTSFITGVLFLPFATISSIVELPLVLKKNNPHLTTDQITEVMFKRVGLTSRNLAKDVWASLQDIAGIKEKTIDSTHPRYELIKFGFEDISKKAAARQDIGGIGPGLSTLYNKFFEVIGLESWTQWMRNVRIGVAQSAIETWTEQYMSDKISPKEWKDANNKLIEMGIDPQVLHIYKTIIDAGNTPSETPSFYTGDQRNLQQVFEDTMRLGVINFVNKGVATPTPGNRPIWYSDPHWKLFTQFQGYSSTFTSKYVPEIMRDLYKGRPSEKLGVITMVGGIVAAAYLSLWLKALAKGDDEEKKDKLLDADWQLFKRVLASAGLLGTAQRGLDVISPTYDFNSKNNIFGELAGNKQTLPSELWKAVSDQSPILRYADGLATYGAHLAKGKNTSFDVDALLGNADEFITIPYRGAKKLTELKSIYDYLFTGGKDVEVQLSD